MGRFIIKRVAQGVLTLWLITVAVFFVLRMGGGNPIEYMLPEDATALDEKLLTEAYGFDKPLAYQYWLYNKKLLRGTWARPWAGINGPSWT
ncbi:MAG: hypothetical protein ACE5Q6_23440 [Dehalococcoidia bacterium]